MQEKRLTIKKILHYSYALSIISILIYILPSALEPATISFSFLNSNVLSLICRLSVFAFSLYYLFSIKKDECFYQKINRNNLLKGCVYFIIIISALFLICIANLLTSKPAINADSLLKLIIYVFSLASFEEIIYRGTLFNEIISNNRDSKGLNKAFYISSFIFGLSHVLDYNTLVNFFQWNVLILAILKTIQTFILGCFFSSQLIKTRSLLWTSFLHFLFNFFPFISFVSSSYAQNEFLFSYTDTSNYSYMIGAYTLYILLEIPLFVSSKKILNIYNENSNSKNEVIAMDNKAFYKLSYGVFLVSTKFENTTNACITNTCIQISSSPLRLGLSCINNNFTTELIKKSGSFIVCVLDKNVSYDFIKHFGMQSGHDVDKFASIKYKVNSEGIRYIDENVCAIFECKVVSGINLNSHTFFISEVTDAKIVNSNPPLTYEYYQSDIKPKMQLSAANIPEISKTQKIKGWRCKICGYIYNGEKLPNDFNCPLCGHSVDDFEPIYEQ